MTRSDLDRAVNAGIISSDQAERLAQFFAAAPDGSAAAPSRFDLAHALWYLGALIVMGAMTMFST
ncbi:MAG: hypothetical protein ACRCTI_10815, partial [Beijerinckiaceae bacterium]